MSDNPKKELEMQGGGAGYTAPPPAAAYGTAPGGDAQPPQAAAPGAPGAYPPAGAYPPGAYAGPYPGAAGAGEALPAAQDAMQALAQLGPAVAYRQDSSVSEGVSTCFHCCWLEPRKYRVGSVPAGVGPVGRTPDEAGRWLPTGVDLETLHKPVTLEEESNPWLRFFLTCVGVGNLRPMTIHYRTDLAATGTTLDMQRPFKCGGWIGCPFEMNMAMGIGGALPAPGTGKVREDCICGQNYCQRFLDCLCRCTFYTDTGYKSTPLAPDFAKKYTLRANMCCCGRTNNCCGATCCKNDAVYDILDHTGNVVGVFRKTYAPGSSSTLGALCRCCCQYSNYLLEFPPDATVEDRALLLSAVTQVDLALADHTGKGHTGQSPLSFWLNMIPR